ncbi:MAG: iron ABC transporter substrate-binding protein [Treponema sp.]|jgi:iron complex transport system substrate-binding protein|nr:iron ABC transporter substrate-binding protein [Treponema sp.]
MKKKLAAFLFGLAIILAGCSGGGREKTAGAKDNLAAEPHVFTDAFGREVTIPGNVKTVAAIGGAARIITYAGCADMLVGVTDMDKSNVTAMPYSVVNAEHFSRLKPVGSGGSNDTPYHEALVMAAPDIIIAMPGSVEVINDVAAKTGIPVLGINPAAMFDESFYFALELLGKALGNEDHCAKVITYIKSCAQDLNDRTKDIADSDKPRVYTGAVSFRGGHGFEGTYGNYPPFMAINAKNVADETGQPGGFLIDLEKVTVWNPDIIFLNPTNMNLVNEDYAKNPAFYDSLRAVKEGNVFTQPSFNYNWTNMEIAIADAYYAGKVIYPKQFEDIDPEKKADEIFTVLLGEPYYAKMAADGMRFEKIVIGNK